MLVVDPAKRITISQIKQHRWMLADQTAPHQVLTYNSCLGDYSEHVLKIMQTLGIDRQRTIEVTAENVKKMTCATAVWNPLHIVSVFMQLYACYSESSPHDSVKGCFVFPWWLRNRLIWVLCQGSLQYLSLALVSPSLCVPMQSLQNSSYNHFSAIYYLLQERVKDHCSLQLGRQCGNWNQRSRSTSDSSVPEVSLTSGCAALYCTTALFLESTTGHFC